MGYRWCPWIVVASSVLLLSCASAQQRWYYTGKFENEEVVDPVFEGSQFVQADLSNPNLVALLYYGGLITNSSTFSHEDYVTTIEYVHADLLGFGVTTATQISYAAALPMVLARNYGVYENFPANSSAEDFLLLHLRAEVGLYDHQSRVFLEKYWRDLSIGELTAVKLSVKHNHIPSANTADHAGTASSEQELGSFEMGVSVDGDATAAVDPADEVKAGIVDLATVDAALNHHTVSNESSAVDIITYDEEHHVVYTTDLMGRSSIYTHTWTVSPTNQTQEACDNNADTQTEKKDVRVMSFNLWHNNPPSWVYHNHKERWDRYTRRMRHFADVIVASDPDIIALQEVRLDSAFLSPLNGHTISHWHNTTANKGDNGNQVEHVLSHLAQARARAAAAAADGESREPTQEGTVVNETKNNNPYYQFVYQPAMSMVDTQRLAFRHEEGVMVLSKFPIVDYQVVLLPRQMDDKSDDHQRVILNVKVSVPETHVTSQPGACSAADVSEPVTIDVMTSHFSLNERARNQGVRTLVQEITRTNNPKYKHSPVQVLMGDFNAEPDEVAIQYLLEEDNFNLAGLDCSAVEETHEASNTTATCEKTQRAPFVDAWQHVQQSTHAATPSTSDEAAEPEVEVKTDAGLTFPACNPVKRIDFIMVRNASVAELHNKPTQAHAEICDFKIEGVRPTADTEYLVNSREGLGMNDKDSPIW
eukprot:gene14181-16306_t